MPENNDTHANPSAPPKGLIEAIKKVLRPFVRMLLSFQITLPYLIELLKETYVEVAERDFRLPNKKQTDTRITLLTGVHRKDTRRLRNQDRSQTELPENVGIGVQLVAKWIADPDYLDEQGKPRRLALKSEDPTQSADFEQLVQSVCKQDMHIRVVLDEWLRLGVVNIVDGEWVELNHRGFIPAKGLEEKAFYLGMNIADHLEASAQNLLAEQPPFIDRCVYYDGLSKASIEVLKQEAETEGMALLQKLNQSALALKEKDQAEFAQAIEQQDHAENDNATPVDETQRMNFGLYFYSQADEGDSKDA